MIAGPSRLKEEISGRALSRKGVWEQNNKINDDRATKTEDKVQQKRNKPRTVQQWMKDAVSCTIENNKDWKYESASTREHKEELAKLSSMAFWNQLKRSDGFYQVTRGVLPYFGRGVEEAGDKMLEK